MIETFETKPISPLQAQRAQELRIAFSQLWLKLSPETASADAGRLFSIARTDLEKSCAMAIKAISRDA